MKRLRYDWFKNWLLENLEFHQHKIMCFQSSTGKIMLDVSLKMIRLIVETVSATSVINGMNISNLV